MRQDTIKKTVAPKVQTGKYNRTQVLSDFSVACLSRQLSLLGRREVLSGKAKFGIFGDGKEIPQLAWARVFREGDWRSGYYRDQTFMLAAGLMTPEEFFAQLYGDTDLAFNPQMAGRVMNNHFATRSLDNNGEWKDLTAQKNSSADISPTAGQMPRLLGLALASTVYRNVEELKTFSKFSKNGDEVAFGTIGDASTSEGHFFETINAAGVLQVPMIVSIWDDGWGISVPKKFQTTKGSISEILAGFAAGETAKGYLIYKVKGWDYPSLCSIYEEAVAKSRKDHIPVIIHVEECTQPQGHSTSGSHERYKSSERLKWEEDFDGIARMKEWILTEELASVKELEDIENKAALRAREARQTAWGHFMEPLRRQRDDFLRMVDISTCNCAKTERINMIKDELKMVGEPIWKDVMSSGKKILRLICNSCSDPNNSLKKNVMAWRDHASIGNHNNYSSHLYSESAHSALKVPEVRAKYAKNAPKVPGREILRDNFEVIFTNYPEALSFGEDVGKIGGVNQTMEGLQNKFGEMRVADTGIREATIIGQGIGLAMRGLRPIAEIQYFDYLLYGLQLISDDLATLHYRTRGGQKAPLIITTRGHRLEGIWHSGSALSMVINSIRGVHVLVPRNMTQAAGFYNTMMRSDEPALIIEPLNGYRIREPRPANIGEFTVPLGRPEILKTGSDITIVTYGACVGIAEEASKQLQEFGIDVELIDVQTLLPFDLEHVIASSLQKTNKALFFDEDVPGGATAYMMQKVLEEQHGYYFLDAQPRTLTARPHRPAYSTDGDYFSNPNAEDVFDSVYNIMHEVNPVKYPKIF
jgi:pyruvate/2-oxoglutarate/acetoin dehydrogenase E1 component/TPP-dependent pyruvate/acetoin dehydrogenase alpha subunit